MAEQIDIECNKCGLKFSMGTINSPDEKLDDKFNLTCFNCQHTEMISMLRMNRGRCKFIPLEEDKERTGEK